jgi:outer membrane protein
MMKNINLVINAVLALALIVVFILLFSLRGQVKELKSQPLAFKTAGSGKIVYINIDTLQNAYEMYFDMKTRIEGKQKKMVSDLDDKKKVFERSVAEYQDKAKKGLLLSSEMQKIEQQLGADQQNLMRLNETMQQQLAEETQVENRKLMNSIIDYLKDYNKDGRFQYIFGHAYGSNLLYASDSLDITYDVLKGLNEKYRSGKK